jgi:hypothetical protein
MKKLAKEFYNWCSTKFTPSNNKSKELVLRLPYDIDKMKKFAGIEPDSSAKIKNEAKQAIIDELVEDQKAKLKQNKQKYVKLQEHAQELAENQLKRELVVIEKVKLQEKEAKKALQRKKDFESKWYKYLVNNDLLEIGPKADDFADFLIKNQFLTKKQLEKIEVSAIIVDNQDIFNYQEFEKELNRVKNI